MFKYLIFCCLIQLSMTACPSGWVGYERSCYLFSQDMEYWTGAFEMCRIIGGQLLEVDDALENNFIVSKAKLTGRQYWLSLSDVVEEGTWVWMGSKAQPSYTNWSTGEPTVTNARGEFENCADMYPSGTWNDVTCTTKKFYVCEKENEIDIIG